MLIALKILVLVAIVAAVLIIMIVRDNRQDRRTRSTPPEPNAWTVMSWTDDNVDRDGTIRHAIVYGPFHGVEGFMIAQQWMDMVHGLRPDRYRMEIIMQPLTTITNSPLEVSDWPEYRTVN